MDEKELLDHPIYAPCPVCRGNPPKAPPDVTYAAQIDTDEVWISLLCPVCLTVIILKVTIYGDEEQ